MDYHFKSLGQPITGPSKELETFPKPEHVTLVTLACDELTSFCPVTAQPDFSMVEISYQPDKLCVESKSLKLYLWSFREQRIFGEGLAATIAHDIFERLQPFTCKVRLHQHVRGGIQLTAVAECQRDGVDT